MNQPTTALRDEYLNHISTQKTSDLSTAAYCKLHNLNLNKFYHYKSYRPAEAKGKIKIVHNFTQVKIKPIEDGSGKQLSTAANTSRHVVGGIDPEWLAKFIFTLSRCK
ncbi:MAG: hypothetical protein H7328_12195 [Bdellovibrio sp.]|nr:hypothetical protein [Bdellovibrio sp.]